MCLSVFHLKLRSRFRIQVGIPGHFTLELPLMSELGVLSSTKFAFETEHITCGVHVLKLVQYLEAMAGLKAELSLELRYCKRLT